MSDPATETTLAEDDAQYRAYLLQRAGGDDQRCFVWVDDRWPSCPALRSSQEHLRAPVDPVVAPTIATLYNSNPQPDTIPAHVWVRYLARISYCAEICLHPDEAVDAVLHAEVGETDGPRADALRSHLEHAVRVLRLAGMMGREFGLVTVSR